MEKVDVAPSREAKSVPAFSVHLDTVRGLAALAVFLGHGTYMFLGTNIREQATEHLNRAAAAAPAAIPADRTHLGHQAVIVFFVLSGFFVGGGAVRALRSGRWSWKSYLLQRLTRLWVVLAPALLLGLVLDSIGVRFFLHTSPVYAKLLAATGGNTGLGRLTATNFFGNLFFLQGIRVPIFGSDAPLWSLSYEFWYYIMFPLLLIAAVSSRRIGYRAFSIAAAIAVAVFCGKDISLYYLIWLMGVAAFLLPRSLSQTLAYRITPWVCLIFAGFNLLVVIKPFNLALSDFSTAIFFSVVLWLILHYRQPASQSLYRSAATHLSAMSYTLYTVHYSIFVFIKAWLVPTSARPSMSLHSIATLLGVYAFTFCAAYLIYRCFEANTAHVRRFVAKRLSIA
jgi:peptidoglycan/LPS O-acetylase OafA/YrhL